MGQNMSATVQPGLNTCAVSPRKIHERQNDQTPKSLGRPELCTPEKEPQNSRSFPLQDNSESQSSSELRRSTLLTQPTSVSSPQSHAPIGPVIETRPAIRSSTSPPLSLTQANLESFNDSQVPSNTPTPNKSRATFVLSTEKVPTTVHQIIDTIKQYKRGQLRLDGGFLRFRIDKLQYHDLEKLLLKDEFCRNKLRYDYFPLQRLFVIRMASNAHELFLAKVHYEISRQLRNLVESPLSEFAKTIEYLGSPKFIPSNPEFGPHSPDASFGHAGEQFPGLVIEVAYSQEGKTLGELADDYILGSHLRVRVLAAFDVPYKKKEKTARLTVWRPRLLQEEHGELWTTSCEEQVFRDDSGEPNLDPDSGLRLHLRDFARVEYCEQFGNIEGTIFVSCATLCSFWNDVESTESIVTANPVFLRTRRHSPIPEEQLDTDDERDFVEAEQRAAKSVARDDSSFKASSSEEE